MFRNLFGRKKTGSPAPKGTSAALAPDAPARPLPVDVTDATFDEVVFASAQLAVVDFWAEWCGPCKMIGPALEEIATSLGPKAKIVKINIDENPGTPSRYGVRGIPTLMVFKGGQVAATKVGAAPKNALQSWIEQSI